MLLPKLVCKSLQPKSRAALPLISLKISAHFGVKWQIPSENPDFSDSVGIRVQNRVQNQLLQGLRQQVK